MSKADADTRKKDSLALAQMIALREEAMIAKDVTLVMPQFADDATWINSQGYFFEGKNELEKLCSHLCNKHVGWRKEETIAPWYQILDGLEQVVCDKEINITVPVAKFLIIVFGVVLSEEDRIPADGVRNITAKFVGPIKLDNVVS
mgnify:CR=1 FL=1